MPESEQSVNNVDNILVFNISCYLCSDEQRGAVKAEIIPSEPETGNAGAGIV